MSVLSWDKPEQVMSKEDWKSCVFDGGPPGSYIPNMSEEDRVRWKAKFVGGKYPRVEIRKTFTAGQHVQAVIVVSPTGKPIGNRGWGSCKNDFGEDINVKMSMNGSACMTFQEFDNLWAAISEARLVLEKKA
jgi:hypothetical protein